MPEHRGLRNLSLPTSVSSVSSVATTKACASGFEGGKGSIIDGFSGHPDNRHGTDSRSAQFA